MLQYYGVFGLLVVESVLLLLFLLPLGRFGLNLSIRIISAIKIPAWLIFGLLTFFTVDQTMDMRRHEEKLRALPANTPLDKEQHLREQKFRSERNFYLTLFTTTLLFIILRLESILRTQQSRIVELETKVNFSNKSQ